MSIIDCGVYFYFFWVCSFEKLILIEYQLTYSEHNSCNSSLIREIV